MEQHVPPQVAYSVLLEIIMSPAVDVKIGDREGRMEIPGLAS